MHTITNPTAATTELAAVTRLAAQERADYEDGRTATLTGTAGMAAAFERAWSAGATREEVEQAYKHGVDWGDIPLFA